MPVREPEDSSRYRAETHRRRAAEKVPDPSSGRPRGKRSHLRETEARLAREASSASRDRKYRSANGAQETNTYAVLALVFAFVFSPLGIIFGLVARRQIREDGGGGDGLALAGLVLGTLFTCISGLLLLVEIVAVVSVARVT